MIQIQIHDPTRVSPAPHHAWHDGALRLAEATPLSARAMVRAVHDAAAYLAILTRRSHSPAGPRLYIRVFI